MLARTGEVERGDIEFLLQAMQDFVADRAVITKTDQSHALSGHGFMLQTLNGFGGRGGHLFLRQTCPGEALQPLDVPQTH